MRKRIWITGIVIAAVCLLLIWLKAPRHQTTTLPSTTEEVTSQPPSHDQAVPPQPVEPATKGAPSSNVMAEMAQRRAVEETNALQERQKQALATWRAPIDFFGKVVDENTNPVAGATITFSWSETPTYEGEQKATAQSDAEGLFSLRDKHGPSLVVWVSKHGYYASGHGQKGFDYMARDLSPDPQNPVIFQLRRKGQGVELITSENGVRLKVNARVPRDNTPVLVDLFQKQPSATGQLEISQIKPAWQGATNWSFRVSIPDGGLVENRDEFQFEAPQTNYKPTVEYHFTKSETNWTTQLTQQFYIAFGQPRKYGWLRIESNLAQETVFLTYAINPTGSRNLEPK